METRYYGLRGKKLLRFMLYAIVFPVYLWFGYNNGVAGGLLTLESFTDTFPAIDTVHTTGSVKDHQATVQGTVVALYTVGCAVGSLSCIVIGDKLGRLRTGFIGSIIGIVGAVLQASAYQLPQLIVGRVVSGIGFGAVTATIPVWQAECSTAEHRGAFVVMQSLIISIGLFISQYLDLGLYFVDSSASWRFPLAFPSIFGLIIVTLILKCPESPRWLIKMGRIEDAKHVLAALNDLPVDDPQVIDNVHNVQMSLEETGKGRFRDIFTNGPNRIGHRALLASGLQMFMQMCGINVIGFYCGTLFEEYIGLTPVVSRVLSACTFTFQGVCSLFAIYTIDRLGRRKLLLGSALGMGLCMVALAASVAYADQQGPAIVASVFIFLFTAFFPQGYLGIPFLYATEVSPLAHRVPISGIATATSWAFNFLVAEVTPVAFSNIGYQYYIVYAVINLCLIVPSIYFLFPETKGRPLEEMDLIFLRSRNIFDPVKVARSLDLRGSQDSILVSEEKVARSSMEKQEVSVQYT
uniref:ARAD1B17908p n=1 Tax=Blastobotrys adeninivorans TaxID=409370 RepID=A0A060TBT6_BLAAD